MPLSEIAAGIEVTTEQCDRGVASVDRTDVDLADRLGDVAAELPCDAEAAATLVEAYATGKSVGESGRLAGLAPITAAKTLHRFGEQVCPLSPTARDVVGDWLDGRLSRSEARTLTGASEREFALATYVQTHEPSADARAAAEGALTSDDATGEKLASLGESVEAGDRLR